MGCFSFNKRLCVFRVALEAGVVEDHDSQQACLDQSVCATERDAWEGGLVSHCKCARPALSSVCFFTEPSWNGEPARSGSQVQLEGGWMLLCKSPESKSPCVDVASSPETGCSLCLRISPLVNLACYF